MIRFGFGRNYLSLNLFRINIKNLPLTSANTGGGRLQEEQMDAGSKEMNWEAVNHFIALG